MTDINGDSKVMCSWQTCTPANYSPILKCMIGSARTTDYGRRHKRISSHSTKRRECTTNNLPTDVVELTAPTVSPSKLLPPIISAKRPPATKQHNLLPRVSHHSCNRHVNHGSTNHGWQYQATLTNSKSIESWRSMSCNWQDSTKPFANLHIHCNRSIRL